MWQVTPFWWPFIQKALINWIFLCFALQAIKIDWLLYMGAVTVICLIHSFWPYSESHTQLQHQAEYWWYYQTTDIQYFSHCQQILSAKSNPQWLNPTCKYCVCIQSLIYLIFLWDKLYYYPRTIENTLLDVWYFP